MYSYVIEVADSESDLGLHGKALVSEILLFLRIPFIHPQSKYPTYALITLINLIIVKKNLDKNFDQGVHDHDVLVDLVHIPFLLLYNIVTFCR